MLIKGASRCPMEEKEKEKKAKDKKRIPLLLVGKNGGRCQGLSSRTWIGPLSPSVVFRWPLEVRAHVVYLLISACGGLEMRGGGGREMSEERSEEEKRREGKKRRERKKKEGKTTTTRWRSPFSTLGDGWLRALGSSEAQSGPNPEEASTMTTQKVLTTQRPFGRVDQSN